MAGPSHRATWRDVAALKCTPSGRSCSSSSPLPGRLWTYAARSTTRTDGRHYRRDMTKLITAPTLHLHGSLDRCVLPQTAQGSGQYVAADYEWRVIYGVGHFPHQESPDLVTSELLRWCKDG